MTGLRLRGRARLFGDDVNTDAIVSSVRKRESLDPLVLRHYLFEHVDPGFAGSIAHGDLLVAGRNFGCGSAMEVAATAVLAAGIPAVLACGFARTYYRNAVNNGLVPVVCDTGRIREADMLEIDVDNMVVRNESTSEKLIGEALPPIMVAILSAGGLVPYMRQHGDFLV